MPTLRLGTRQSALAMWQAQYVKLMLDAVAPEVTVEIVPVVTIGDTDMRPFDQLGGRGVFVKELEAALLAGEIDCAVHSAKDLALEMPDGLRIAAYPVRERASDTLVGAPSLEGLPEAATVATGSVRRTAILAHLRPDISAVPIRGNVGTRLERYAELGCAATLLATAGLRRLGLPESIGAELDVATFVPEAGQGAIAVQVASGAGHVETVAALDDARVRQAIEIERAVALHFGGSCMTPVGVHVDAENSTAHWFIGTTDKAAPTTGAMTLSVESEAQSLTEKIVSRIVSVGATVTQ